MRLEKAYLRQTKDNITAFLNFFFSLMNFFKAFGHNIVYLSDCSMSDPFSIISPKINWSGFN